MQTKNFSIIQAFKFAFNALFTWHNVSKFILLHALSLGIAVLELLVLALLTTGIHLRYILNPQQGIDFYKNYFTTHGASISLITVFVLFALFAYAAYIFVGFCSMKMSLDIYDTGKADLGVAITTIRRIFFKLFGLCVVLMLGTIAGFIFLIVPGVIFMLSSLFSTYVLVDKNSSIMEALRASWALTKGIRMKLLGFFLLLVFAVGVPAALLSVLFRTFFLWQVILTVMRYFVSPIISQLMMAFIYRSLQKSNI